MKNTTLNRLRIRHISVLLGLTTCFYIPSPAQTEEEGAEPLRLEFIPNKVEFKVGEPIIVQVKLINLTGAPLEMPGQFYFGGNLGIDYKYQNDRDFWPYSGAFTTDYSYYEPTMVPVEGLIFTAFLAHDSMKRSRSPYALFDRAGNYIFKASFWPFKGKQLWSDEVIVTVTEPTGVDALALERWMDDLVLWAVQGYIGPSGEKGVEKLRALVAEYPNSIYGQYAQRELAIREQAVETKDFYVDPQARVQMETPAGELQSDQKLPPKPEPQERKAQSESDPEEENFRVKVGTSEFPIILEDGNYENLDKAGLIWTVNNLFEAVYFFKIIDYGFSVSYHINGREVETNLFMHIFSGGDVIPFIRGKHHDIIEENGVYHLVLAQKFIQEYIEASEYEEITSELNDFIDQVNGIESAEFDNLTKAEIESMLYIDPGLADEFVGVEKKRTGLREFIARFSLRKQRGWKIKEKRKGLREFIEDIHFQSTNVFWIGESIELGRYLYGNDAESMIFGEAAYYTKKGNLVSAISREKWKYDLPPLLRVHSIRPPFLLSPRLKGKYNLPPQERDDEFLKDSGAPGEKGNYNLPPPSNFDPRLHTDPDAEPFIWIPLGRRGFIYDDRKWKVAILMPGE